MDILVGGFGPLNGQTCKGIERFAFTVDAHNASFAAKCEDEAEVECGAEDGNGCNDSDTIRVLGHDVLADLPSPTWLERDGDMLYAVLENTGEIASLRIERDDNGLRLRELRRVPVQGDGPTHAAVAVDSEGQRHLVVADYGDGSIAVHPIGDDGSTMQGTQMLRSEGHGPLPAQAGPHAHWVLPLPDGRVLTTDLGADRIYVHQWDHGVLRRVGAVMLAPGTGPRDMHLMPANDGGWRVAVVGEWGDSVTLLACDDVSGSSAEHGHESEHERGRDAGSDGIRVVQTVDLGGDTGDQAASLAYVPSAAALAARSDGSARAARSSGSARSGGSAPTAAGFAYIGLRGSERIITLAWDGERFARLAEPETPGWRGCGILCGGKRPRQLVAFDALLFAADETSNNIAVFELLATGEPRECARFDADSPTVIVRV
ncbi:lactonase family protein [Bifidobacterium tibiigranuli]|jgi:6-phosphogluconolactonase (cycloisomerase 2 family)|uniref:lactonase family protein n=1 Tax=Bifidobacterium tibiigranuli TaxID=2172043 RepID=UPI0026F08095|nr:beta-propeller fold lactonase family protein [Bifidobacterium tibiigranuli]MCI1649787.1 lactonase family protein [Bifidobacterium tibiigranuli]MCI2186622.1 lactonase family protein [Bifidobacterium tibiigranuli]MCI2204228.1 lactonase family protein [Bifidobacterium tibiigranuli]